MTTPRVPTSPCKGEVGREAAGRGSKPRFSRTTQMTKRARNLRGSMTDAEAKLWRAVRRNQIDNLNFRRQHPIGPYTLDFYCPSLKLGIELDGGQHAEESKQVADRRRTGWLASKGIHIIRFWNNDVLSNLSGVLTEIARIASERSKQLSTPSPPLPLSGGGVSPETCD
jgi:very-short-patch-repair endonuclease